MRLLVLLLAAILFGFGSTRARAQGSLETDKEALVALYDATDGANWANNLNWKTDQALSTWSGVTTGAGGRVTGLNLSFNSLSGTIPTELGDLTALQTLNFANNSGLTGGIPTQLGSLTALRTLDLSNNSGLTGGIPTELGDLTALEYLDLGGCWSLSGTIPTQLASLTALKQLDLSLISLTGGIPTELGDLTALEDLDLRETGLTGEIPTELGKLTALNSLDLSKNSLSGGIPAELRNLTALKDLNLRRNGLTGTIPTALGNLTALRQLGLSSNGLTGTIPTELRALTKLEHLQLNSNRLSGSIPTELGDLTALTRLDLSSNYELTGTIPTELGKLTALEYLQLNHNQLSGSIPAELEDLTALFRLNLKANGLSGAIPAVLGDLGALDFIDLSENSLSGTIPAELGGMAKLETLRLNRNSLSGSFPGGFPVLDELNLLRSGACLPEGLFSLDELSYVGPICTPDSNTESLVTVAVFYTPNARLGQGGTAEIETLIDLMIAETNAAYADSGVKQRLFLVAREEVEYAEGDSSSEDLNKFRGQNDNIMDEVHAIRERVGADIVHLIVDRTQGGDISRDYCGLAPQVEQESVISYSPYVISDYACGSLTFAHELGHLMGLGHDTTSCGDTCGAIYEYGKGYVNQRAFEMNAAASSRWRTIMSTRNRCVAEFGSDCQQLLRFSNPNQQYLDDPQGDPLGVADQADAVRALNSVRGTVANYWWNSPLAVSFSRSAFTAEEGGRAATVRVKLSKRPGLGVVIPLTAMPGGGALDGDYSGVPMSVTLNSGETSKVFDVVAVGDQEDEDGETVVLGFGTPLPEEVNLGSPSSATVALVDNAGGTGGPELSSARVSGTVFRLIYDEALDQNSTPLASAFTVIVANAEGTITRVTVSTITVSGQEVLLTLGSAAAFGRTVTVSYMAPTGATATPIQNSNGDDAASFTDLMVTAAPFLTNVDVDGDGAFGKDDALAMYYAYVLSDVLGDGEHGGFARFRQELLGRQSEGSNPSDEELQQIVLKANTWKDGNASAGVDVNGDDSFDKRDALAMYYIYEFAPNTLVFSGSDGLRPTGLARTLLSGLADGSAPSDADLLDIVVKANEFKNAVR